jgi:hypothetical protein
MIRFWGLRVSPTPRWEILGFWSVYRVKSACASTSPPNLPAGLGFSAPA